MKKPVDNKISENLDYYIAKGRVDKNYPQFYKIIWKHAECLNDMYSETCKFPAIYKYILISDIEKSPKLFKAIQKREYADEHFASPYSSFASITASFIKYDFAMRNFERVVKSENIKLYTKEERAEYENMLSK